MRRKLRITFGDFIYNFLEGNLDYVREKEVHWIRDILYPLPNLFNLLEDEDGEELPSDYFGTYVCPECRYKAPVLTRMEGYYLGE